MGGISEVQIEQHNSRMSINFSYHFQSLMVVVKCITVYPVLDYSHVTSH